MRYEKKEDDLLGHPLSVLSWNPDRDCDVDNLTFLSSFIDDELSVVDEGEGFGACVVVVVMFLDTSVVEDELEAWWVVFAVSLELVLVGGEHVDVGTRDVVDDLFSFC